MGQVSQYLRKTEDGYTHWCPGCEQMHSLPDTWNFSGNIDAPTFTPSFLHKGNLLVLDENGSWTGEWQRDSSGKSIPYVCHYILTDGILNFCSDSTHALRGQSISMAELPKGYKDN